MDGSIDTRLDTILIAVDFNEPSMNAAEWAARMFESASSLIFVSVIEPPPPPPSLAQRFPSPETLVVGAGAEAQKKLTELAGKLAPGRSTAEVRVGRPHQEILALAQEKSADVIVVGRQQVGSAGWARVGAIAQRLLRTARIPILVVSGEGPDSPQEILAAVDDSPMTSPVLEWVRILSEHFSAEATALHVLMSQRSPEETAQARAWLERRVSDSGASRRPKVVAGARRAAEAILSEARDLGAGLIVIGSHGAGAKSDVAFGSVAESVVVSAPCPVFVALGTGILNSEY